MDNKVTVLVASYNPSLEKMFLTLNSILLQKEIGFKVVIVDDGSKNNYYDKIGEFFKENKFFNYKLIANKENKGTVKNLFSGLQNIDTKYVKFISPGDCFYSETTLKKWVSFMDRTNCSVSFGRAVDYRVLDDGKSIKTFSNRISPQDQKAYKIRGDRLRKSYLIYNDMLLGAAMLGRTDIILKYIKLIVDKVKYGEDFAYRIMIYNGESVSLYQENAILYEFGIGVASSRNKIWSQRLYSDLAATNKVIETIINKSEELPTPFDKKFINNSKIVRYASKNEMLKKVLKLRKALYLFAKNGFRFYYSSEKYDKEFVEKLLKCNKGSNENENIVCG